MTDPTNRVALVVAYDGAPFHGFAENAGVRTVGGDLSAALATVRAHDVAITCAGRTDAGVHAVGQVVTFDTVGEVDTTALRDSLNGILAPHVVVRAAAVVPGRTDARFSARSRTYRYVVRADPVPDPFTHRTAWWVRHSLDLDAMSAAARDLVGEHDFSAFCRRPRGAEVSLVRRVLSAGWSAGSSPGALVFEVTATAFCHQMVRSIVGALVAVGSGRRGPDVVAGMIASGRRDGAPNLAPPHGLFLWSVDYDPADGVPTPALAAVPGPPLL